MKRIVIVCVVLLCFGGLTVSASTVEELYNEQLEASGGNELLEALPQETKHLLSRLGIDSLETVAQTDSRSVIQELSAVAVDVLREPLNVAGTVMLIVILYAWIEGLRSSLNNEESSAVFGTVCALALCGSVMLPLSACITQVGEAMTSVSVFMGSFTPVYAGILLSGGRAASAVSFQSLSLYAAQLLSWLSSGIIVPLMTVSLALGVTGSVTPQIRLSGASKLLSKTAVWLLTFGMLLFTGVLSLQNLTSGAADTLGTRALKFSIARFVPVVGASLSEAFSTLRGCLQLLRSTVGGFGVVATALIVIPPLLRCLGWSLLLSVCRTASELFELRAMTDVLEAARSTVRCLIGVLCASGSFLIVAVTVMTNATAGG